LLAKESKITLQGENQAAPASEPVTMALAEMDLDLDVETERVMLWRTEEMERAGYTTAEARDLAERPYVDLHLAVALIRQGCPRETAVRILV
jgi:hypothetical protein